MIKYKVIGQRNPIVEFYDENKPEVILYCIQLVGDSHLGRKFINNVPKHRLGHRSNMVFEKFKNILDCKDIKVDMYVMLGDLFDKTTISNEALSQTIDIVKSACIRNPNCLYYILSGNHDLSRDSSKISSFSLFKKYFTETLRLDNLHIIDQYTLPITIAEINSLLYFANYDPFQTLDEYVQTQGGKPLVDIVTKHSKGLNKICFGHFEVESFDPDNPKYRSDLIPQFIKDNFHLYCGGHIHLPSRVKFNDCELDVIIAGSLQPFAFGEEIKEDGGLYVTAPLDVCNKLLERNIECFKNSNVRILYDRNEAINLPDFDCLSKVFKLIHNGEQESTFLSDLKTNSEPISFKSLVIDSLNKVEHLDIQFVNELKQIFNNREYNNE